MQLNLLAAIAERFLSDRIEFVRRHKKPLAVAGAVLAILLLGLWIYSLIPTKPVRRQIDLRPLTLTDTNGDVWALDLIKGQPVQQFVEGDSAAEPGPPLKARADIRREGPILSIGLIVEGALGEQYVGGVLKNKQWQEPPGFTISDLNGRVIVRDKFKYG